MTPAWLLDSVAGLMLAVAALSAARLAAPRSRPRGGPDVAHLLMAVAMAGMLAPRLRTLPDVAWEVTFAVLAAWFAVTVARDTRRSGVRALAGGHCAPHLVHSASMLYMALARRAAAPAAAGTGGPGMPASAMTLRYPALALLFAIALAGYSVWDLDQLSRRRYASSAARVPGIPSPAVTVGCRAAMGIAMAFTLFTAI